MIDAQRQLAKACPGQFQAGTFALAWADAFLRDNPDYKYGAGAGGTNSHCRACGGPLLITNATVDDGCPCNSPRGVNFAPRPCLICKEDCVKPGHHFVKQAEMPAAASSDEFGWVIEQCFNGVLRYWNGMGVRSDSSCWEQDPDRAIRFSREHDAVYVLSYALEGFGRATMHSWPNVK